MSLLTSSNPNSEHHVTRSPVRARGLDGPASPALTLSPLRRGRGDPCFQVGADGAIWRTSLMPSGPVTARITKSAHDSRRLRGVGRRRGRVRRDAPGAARRRRRRERVRPAGADHRGGARRVPHLRLGRTGRVLEALIPAVLEQRVAGKDAFRAWRLLVTKFGVACAGAGARRACGCRRRRRCGGASRPGSSTAPTSTPAGPARWSRCAQRADALERLAARPASRPARR